MLTDKTLILIALAILAILYWRATLVLIALLLVLVLIYGTAALVQELTELLSEHL